MLTQAFCNIHSDFHMEKTGGESWWFQNKWSKVYIYGTIFFTSYTFLKIFFTWDSLHVRLNGYYQAWSYKNYRKSLYKESTVIRCLLILDLKQLRL